MLTREQRAAIARRNGARSRGPVTATGKARSSRNGLRHGLTAGRHLLLEGEAPDAFEQLRQACLARFQPDGPIEIRLVDRIAEASWKLQRADALETGALNAALTNSPGLAAAFQLPEVQDDLRGLDRYSATAARALTRALDKLAFHCAVTGAASVGNSNRLRTEPTPPSPEKGEMIVKPAMVWPGCRTPVESATPWSVH